MRGSSRRSFLRTAGLSVLAAPFLNLLSGKALAAGTGAKRLIIFFSPNGCIPHRYFPEGTTNSWSFKPNSVLEPLAPIKSELTVFKGLDFYGATNHEGGMGAMLTGNGSKGDVGDGKSIDQFVAPTLSEGLTFPSLELGAWTSPWGGSVQTRMVYSGPGSFVTPDDNPASVYQRMFGDVSASAAEKAALKARRLGVLDLVQGEVQQLHTALGSEEKIKLDAHLSALQDIETKLTAPESACSPPAAPSGLSPANFADFPLIAEAQIDLGTLALACGMTNVLTLQMSHTVSPVACSWLGVNQGHHALSHSGDGATAGVEDFVTCERWFAEQFLYLVNRLKSLPDPETGGSLYDDAVVIWAKEMGDSRMHVCTDVPFVIAGTAGGTVTPGRFHDYGGIHHNRLLVTLAQALGFDIDTYGDPNGGSGALEGLA